MEPGHAEWDRTQVSLGGMIWLLMHQGKGLRNKPQRGDGLPKANCNMGGGHSHWLSGQAKQQKEEPENRPVFGLSPER